MKALLCLACGASLSSSGVCEFCGTAHESDGTLLVEHYARCPKCKRNDQVKKISSIPHQEIKLLNLPVQLIPPKKPKFLSVDTGLLQPSINFALLFLLTLIVAFLLEDVSGCIGPIVIFGAGSSITWMIYKKHVRSIEKKNYEKEMKYNEQIGIYKSTVEKYEFSYYCCRDGTIFTYKPKS